MKSLILITFSLFVSLTSLAQDKSITTATLSVRGNCEECKKRIENAADIKGVKFSSWNEEKQSLTVTYRSDKVSLEQIEKAIAGSGHDTKDIPADSSNYAKLPSCCKYRDKACETKK